MAEDTIVVTGTRETDDSGNMNIMFSYGGTPGIKLKMPKEVSKDGPATGEATITVSVRVKQTKSVTKMEDLVRAAEKLIETVINLLTALENASDWDSVVILTKTYTVGTIKADLLNTVFEITDEEFGSSNLGVGAAVRHGEGSRHLDRFNYQGFMGWAARPGGANAIILHEVVHLTALGAAFLDRSRQVFNSDPTVSGQNFYATPYGQNNEALVSAVMTGIASLSSIDTGGNFPNLPNNQPTTPVLPESIYETNNGTPYGN